MKCSGSVLAHRTTTPVKPNGSGAEGLSPARSPSVSHGAIDGYAEWLSLLDETCYELACKPDNGSPRTKPNARGGFYECVRYGRQLDKRAEVGIACDPVVRNRFRLWAAWTGALGISSWPIVAFRIYAQSLLAQGLVPREEMPWVIPAAALIMGTALIIVAVALWLAFFPPASYVARIHCFATRATPADA